MDLQKEFIIDFARRTRANLEFIEAAEKRGENVFEFTQLANSLLGLLVFPQQHYMDRIPETPLTELVEQGWPNIRTTYGQLRKETLRELIRMLRHGIAHCNVKFLADDDGQISGIRVWNIYEGKKTWEAELTIDDIRSTALKFVELIEQDGLQGTK